MQSEIVLSFSRNPKVVHFWNAAVLGGSKRDLLSLLSFAQQFCYWGRRYTGVLGLTCLVFVL